MEVKLNNLINNTKLVIYINSRDTVIDIKKLIASSFGQNNEINISNISLYYIDPQTNQISYMLSPYRTILSYNGICYTKEIFIEQIGFQLDSALAIILENLLPIITTYYYYKKNDYLKLLIHKIVFLLTCFYFICRFFICLKCYNNGKYFLLTLILNSIIYWFLYSIICGRSIYNDDIDEMNIYSYFFTIVFIFGQILCLKFVKEYKDNKMKNIIFNYVKYPYFTMDCVIWLSMMFIVFNKKIIFFTIIKILYNIYLAFEQYIEEQGMVKISSNLDNGNYNYYYNNNSFQINNNQINKDKIKVIFPFIL